MLCLRVPEQNKEMLFGGGGIFFYLLLKKTVLFPMGV